MDILRSPGAVLALLLSQSATHPLTVEAVYVRSFVIRTVISGVNNRARAEYQSFVRVGS